MAEQFAFDHAVGESLAVDRDEGAVRASAPVVEHARDQLFAGAAFALDEGGRARRRDPPNHRDQLLALRALGDEAGGRAGDVESLAQAAVLALQRAHLDRPRDGLDQGLRAERLGNVVEGALAHRGDRRGDAVVRRKQDHRDIGPPRARAAQQFQPVHPGTAHGRYDDFTALLGEGEGGVGARANLGIVALFFERFGKKACGAFIVLDEQDCPVIGLYQI